MKIAHLKGEWVIRTKHAVAVFEDGLDLQTEIIKNFLDAPIYIHKIEKGIVYYFRNPEATELDHFQKCYLDDTNWERYTGFLGEAPVPLALKDTKTETTTKPKATESTETTAKETGCVGIQTR